MNLGETPKSQVPSSREAPNPNGENRTRDSGILDIGYWDFLGAWGLGFGAFTA
jgi:hypothetical protein